MNFFRRVADHQLFHENAQKKRAIVKKKKGGLCNFLIMHIIGKKYVVAIHTQ